jgi:D-glycero-D-manno-heptose 1,7-bisphosphate phosphatase
LLNSFNSFPAVFLDRDGVITVPISLNGKGYAPRDLKNFKYYEDAKSALLRTREQGFLNIVVSNQPDIANGLLSEESISKMNIKMLSELALNDVIICPHNSKQNCICRKPKPGMILDACKKHAIDLSTSWIVGDRNSDIEAGVNAGIHTVFIDRMWNDETGMNADFKCNSLNEAVDVILKNSFKF